MSHSTDTDPTTARTDHPDDAEQRALCEAATPGPWEADGPYVEGVANCAFYRGPDDSAAVENVANAAFIAAARTALPRLLDERAGLRSQLIDIVTSGHKVLDQRDALLADWRTVAEALRPMTAMLAACEEFPIDNDTLITADIRVPELRAAAAALAIAERHANKEGGNDAA